MTATVRAGAKGVDFSFAHPPAARLRELGYTFVVGYISVPPASPAKNITRSECEAYIAAGLAVLLVWEMSATRASLGAPYGVLDGSNAKSMALARGYPTDVPILVADDTNTVATNLDTHEAYMRAFATACAPYPIGIYGDTDILGRCAGLWRIGWLPNAWAWSGSSKAQAEAKARALGAHVLQRTGFYIDNTWAVDPNDAIADFPAWGTGDHNSQPEDDDMKIATNEEERQMPWGLRPPLSEIFVVGTRKRSVSQEEYDDLYGGTGAKPLTNATLDKIPDEVDEAAGGGGDPGVADRLAKLENITIQLNDSLGRVGQSVGDIRAGLIKAGGG